MKHICVLGGAGYVGSLLCSQLLERRAQGHGLSTSAISAIEFLPHDNPNFKLIQGDIRNVEQLTEAFDGADVVIDLACISNDASFVLDEGLSTTINLDAFEPMVVAAKEAGVKRFIYASSSSVYGVSDEPDVTEDHPLVPLTLYNKYKGMCEPVLFKHQSDDFRLLRHPARPRCAAMHPRQRLDLSVNILTNHAVNNGKITVFGGSQTAPQPAYPGHVRPLPAAGRDRADKIAGRPSTAASRTCRSWNRADRQSDRRRGNAGAGRHRHRRPRRATICAPITSIPTRFSACWLQAEPFDRGCGARSVPGLQGRQAARQHER